MPDWAAFVGLTVVVLILLLALARASQTAVSGDGDVPESDRDPVDHERTEASADRTAPPSNDVERADAPGDLQPAAPPPVPEDGSLDAPIDRYRPPERRRLEETPAGATVEHPPEMSTVSLLINVMLSQGFLGVVLLAGAWYAEIPAAALGVDLGDPLSTGAPAIAVGVGVGAALYLLNAVGAASAAAFGFDHDQSLRDLLLPDAAGGWALLLGAVLPVIAGFEELLFRAAVIGATSAGFPVSPWLLAVVSSVAFAVGHGAQGRAGIVVTGALGFALAATFVVTNSLLAVVVAHYLINALEFVVSGYFGVEWGEA